MYTPHHPCSPTSSTSECSPASAESFPVHADLQSTSAQCSTHVQITPASPAEPDTPPASPAKSVRGRHTSAHASRKTSDAYALPCAGIKSSPPDFPRTAPAAAHAPNKDSPVPPESAAAYLTGMTAQGTAQPPSSPPLPHATCRADQTQESPAPRQTATAATRTRAWNDQAWPDDPKNPRPSCPAHTPSHKAPTPEL